MKGKFLTFRGAAVTGALIFLSVAASAQTNFFSFSVKQGMVNFAFLTNGNPNGYYILKSATNLTAFTPVMITLSSNAPVYQIPATNRVKFFSASGLNIYAPEATLGDGIDDVFKLNLGLNPLSTSVAGSYSGHNGAGNAPLSWLQYYNQVYGRSVTINDISGRECSVFNFGVPFARVEAVSRSVSIFNAPLTANLEAISREVSVHNTL